MTLRIPASTIELAREGIVDENSYCWTTTQSFAGGSRRPLVKRFPGDLWGGENGTGNARACAPPDWDVVILDIKHARKKRADILDDLHRLRPKLPGPSAQLHPEGQYARRALKSAPLVT